jgi:hypothetical protein
MDIDFKALMWFGIGLASLPFMGLGILIGWGIWG